MRVMGAHHRDPQSIDAPLGGPSVARRVALVPEPFGGDTDASVAEGVRIAGRALEAAGYEVEEIEPPMVFESYLAWAELMMTSLAVRPPLLEALMGEDAQRFLELTKIEFPPATPESMALMHESRYRVEKAWREFMTTIRWSSGRLDAAAVRTRLRHHRRRHRHEGRGDCSAS